MVTPSTVVVRVTTPGVRPVTERPSMETMPSRSIVQMALAVFPALSVTFSRKVSPTEMLTSVWEAFQSAAVWLP